MQRVGQIGQVDARHRASGAKAAGVDEGKCRVGISDRVRNKPLPPTGVLRRAAGARRLETWHRDNNPRPRSWRRALERGHNGPLVRGFVLAILLCVVLVISTAYAQEEDTS